MHTRIEGIRKFENIHLIRLRISIQLNNIIRYSAKEEEVR